jgi:hypothetical protein
MCHLTASSFAVHRSGWHVGSHWLVVAVAYGRRLEHLPAGVRLGTGAPPPGLRSRPSGDMYAISAPLSRSRRSAGRWLCLGDERAVLRRTRDRGPASLDRDRASPRTRASRSHASRYPRHAPGPIARLGAGERSWAGSATTRTGHRLVAEALARCQNSTATKAIAANGTADPGGARVSCVGWSVSASPADGRSGPRWGGR